VYAEYGIATIPFSPEKKPLVKQPHKFGLPGSASLTKKFGDAEIFACYAGHLNGLAVIDVDVGYRQRNDHSPQANPERPPALNAEFGEPMEATEVVKTAKSVWKMTIEGRWGCVL
jgi:hypothetical protein